MEKQDLEFLDLERLKLFHKWNKQCSLFSFKFNTCKDWVSFWIGSCSLLDQIQILDQIQTVFDLAGALLLAIKMRGPFIQTEP